jgi:hypothetical protein
MVRPKTLAACWPNRETGLPAITSTGPRPPDPCDTSIHTTTRGPDAKHMGSEPARLSPGPGHPGQSPAHTQQPCNPALLCLSTLLTRPLPCRRRPLCSLQASGDQHSFHASGLGSARTFFPGACCPRRITAQENRELHKLRGPFGI